MAKMFNSVKLPRLPRSTFNLNYVNNFACYFGQLIPAFVQEVLPGDKITLGNQSVIRFQPLASPLMHKVSYDFRYFFVPNRIVDSNFENIIDGFRMNIDNSDSVDNTFTSNANQIPHYRFSDVYTVTPGATQSPDEKFQYSLWNFFGLPTTTIDGITDASLIGTGFAPISYIWYAYNAIYNYFYRDENIQVEVNKQSDVVQWSNWSKNDYFLSALPFAQKGVTPTMSFTITGDDAPVFLGNAHSMPGSYFSYGGSTFKWDSPNGTADAGARGLSLNFARNDDATNYAGDVSDKNRVNIELNTNSADDPYASRGLWAEVPNLNGGSFNADELRQLFAVQKFLETSAVGGTRFSEFINAHFGAYTGDYRIGKPQYLGGFKNDIVIGEIPQTAEGSQPVGRLRGKGVGASSNSLGSRSFSEHGYIIGIFRILPQLNYIPQGFDKKFIKNSFLDWYFPEFAHLGEQPIRKGELYFDKNTPSNNNDTFGYQGSFAEYRHNKDISTGYMANTYDFWNLSRKFSSQPSLNSDFIQCKGNQSSLMRVFQVQNEPPVIVSCGNLCKASRVIPTYATPAHLI